MLLTDWTFSVMRDKMTSISDADNSLYSSTDFSAPWRMAAQLKEIIRTVRIIMRLNLFIKSPCKSTCNPPPLPLPRQGGGNIRSSISLSLNYLFRKGEEAV